MASLARDAAAFKASLANSDTRSWHSAAAPAAGPAADAIAAAWTAAEAAMRLVRAGTRNWAVTDAVGKIAAAFDCKPVEGACSCSLFCVFRGPVRWG